MKIDYISDLHLDFHNKHDNNSSKWEKKTKQFLETLLPENIGEILIIAGDLSHYNVQSLWCLEYFSKIYKQVFFVLGNHDYYLISNSQSNKYKNNSKNREFELVQNIISNRLYNVVLLYDYEIYEYKGIKFAGSTNWYPLNKFKDKKFFYAVSNDAKLIENYNIKRRNCFESFCYDKLLKEVDIIVTHVPPIIINSHHKYGGTSCYLSELKQFKAKHYVFGHCHEQNIYEKDGVNFYINALGYPNDWTRWMNQLQYSKKERDEFKKEWNKIKSFEI